MILFCFIGLIIELGFAFSGHYLYITIQSIDYKNLKNLSSLSGLYSTWEHRTFTYSWTTSPTSHLGLQSRYWRSYIVYWSSVWPTQLHLIISSIFLNFLRILTIRSPTLVYEDLNTLYDCEHYLPSLTPV